jgi:hypothetical protein
MPLVRLPEKTIITTLYCPLCDGVGRLYRKPKAEIPTPPNCPEPLEYLYTLRCLECGEVELWGSVRGRTAATEAPSS